MRRHFTTFGNSRWTPFGSTFPHGPHGSVKGWPSATRGSSCQRDGVVYVWAFDADSAQFGCLVKVDGQIVRR